MKIGICASLWTYPFNMQSLDILKKIENFGFDAVEFSIEDRSEDNLAAIKESLKKTNLACILGSSFVEGNLLSSDANTIKAGVKYVKESVDVCEYLGSGILAGPVYGSYINTDFLVPAVKNKARQQAVELLKEIGAYALGKNIKIAAEPLNRYETNFLNTANEAVEFVSEINLPNVGLNLDTFHMHMEEKSIKKAILNAGEHLFHLHVPENDRGTPGTGDVDWDGIAESLKNINFSGAIIMESGSPYAGEISKIGAFWRSYDYPPDKMAEEGLKFLRKKFSG